MWCAPEEAHPIMATPPSGLRIRTPPADVEQIYEQKRAHMIIYKRIHMVYWPFAGLAAYFFLMGVVFGRFDMVGCSALLAWLAYIFYSESKTFVKTEKVETCDSSHSASLVDSVV